VVGDINIRALSILKAKLEDFIMAKKTTSAAAPVAKKVKAERNAYIAKAPIRRLMKTEGAGLVAEDAVVLLIKKLEEAAIELTKKAVKAVKDDKRKRLTSADIMVVE